MTPDEQAAVRERWQQAGDQVAAHDDAQQTRLRNEVGAAVQHQFRLELLDDQGKPVIVETPEDGPQPVSIEGGFDIAPQPGIKRGTPLTMPLAINLPPQQLAAGTRS